MEATHTGTACVSVESDRVRLVTGRTFEETITAYQRDALFHSVVNTLRQRRGDSTPFILSPTEYVYELPKELVFPPSH